MGELNITCLRRPAACISERHFPEPDIADKKVILPEIQVKLPLHVQVVINIQQHSKPLKQFLRQHLRHVEPATINNKPNIKLNRNSPGKVILQLTPKINNENLPDN